MNSESLPAGNNSAAVPETGGTVLLDSPPLPPPAGEQFSLPIPAILLESDDDVVEPAGEDVGKFSLGPDAPVEELETEAELPDAYGTEQLLLTARDPHWLCAHWDLTREQQGRHCAQAGDGQLNLRVFRADHAEQPVAEIKISPEARHWFVHVESAGSRYQAQLGYHAAGGGWVSISDSAAAFTPPDRKSSNPAAEFATLPFATPMAQLLSLADEAAAPELSLTAALEKLRRAGHPDLPAVAPLTNWTVEQERALAALSAPAETWLVPMDSLTLVEMSRRPAPGLPTSPGGTSSPFGGFQPEKLFWFNINAELVVYGATEPDATVTIGGRSIQLRPDGSFTYRFSLPDGQYELPVVAISADQTDGRAAELTFSRMTERRGEVGIHPQAPELKPPATENLPVIS